MLRTEGCGQPGAGQAESLVGFAPAADRYVVAVPALAFRAPLALRLFSALPAPAPSVLPAPPAVPGAPLAVANRAAVARNSSKTRMSPLSSGCHRIPIVNGCPASSTASTA